MKEITIDGTDYILTPKKKIQDEEIEGTYTFGYTIEDDLHCFEFSTLANDVDGSLVYAGMTSLTWTHKLGNRINWKEETFDNGKWIKLIIKLDPEEIEEFPEEIRGSSFLLLREAVIKLNKKGWFK